MVKQMAAPIIQTSDYKHFTAIVKACNMVCKTSMLFMPDNNRAKMESQ